MNTLDSLVDEITEIRGEIFKSVCIEALHV
jgi:hypothetical protein